MVDLATAELVPVVTIWLEQSWYSKTKCLVVVLNTWVILSGAIEGQYGFGGCVRQRFRTCIAIGALALSVVSPGLAQRRYADLPVAFEPNLGQSDQSVRFLSRGAGMTAFFTDTEVVMLLHRSRKQQGDRWQSRKIEQTVVRMKLLGANAPREARGLELLSGVSNYYLGNDPAHWQTGVPQYGRLSYRGVYPGIDLVCYGNQRNLEYDFVVAPGADPRRVQVAWEGVDSQMLNRDGDLVLQTPLGEMVQKRPRVYQETSSGRVEVAAHYVLAPGRRVGFELARYDRRRPLIIDPQLVYSTYLGGNSADYGYAIAVDSSGAAYVTGDTASGTFPVVTPLKTTNASTDAFVTKISPSGNSLVYSTFLGGGGNDHGFAIAVDSSGSAYITGDTSSANFPVASGFQATLGGGFWDAFVTKLTAAGALSYSTYFGGNGIDEGHGIAVDSSGAAYVGGLTTSTNFPLQSPIQASSKGGYDAFVAKIAPAGNALIYSTYLGGAQDDQALALAVDSSGSAYVTGPTGSADFPVVSAYQSTYKFGDAFVAKLAPSGASLVYSTYLGGSSGESSFGIAVDSAGSAYVTGRTLSADFPVVAGAYQSKLAGNYDVFVTKLAAAGNALVYSTYVGGKGSEAGYAIALDSAGSVYVTGWTNSTDFLTLSQVQTDQGADDGFAFKLSADGSALVYSTYLGGSGNDYAQGIAVDPTGAAYVAGWTDSTDFITKSPFQTDQSSTDAFVAKIEPAVPAGSKAVLISPTPGSTLTGPTVTFTWTSATGATAYGLGVGTGQGNDDIYNQELGLATSQTVTGIPTNGSTIWVRLVTKINGSVVWNDYQFKAFLNGSKPVMTSPAPGSVLPGSSVTFTWLIGTGSSSTRLDVGTAVGQGDIFGKNVGLATSQTVTGIPTNGSTIYVRLTASAGTLLLSNDYTYTAAGGTLTTKAVMTSPAPGSTLSGSSVNFTWTAGTGAVLYWLDVGSVAGGVDFFDQNLGLATSQTVTGLPTDGSTIYVRLWTGFGSTYQYNDYTYKASGGSSRAVLTGPAPGSTLTSGTVTFTWTAGTGATAYYLYVGTVQGLGDVYSQNVALATSQAVSAIPTNGSTVYVRLWTLFGSTWQYNDYTYTASGGNSKAVILLPVPGTVLSGAAVTFTWSAGTGATAYYLYVGTVQGLGDVYSQNVALATSQAVSGIPIDGSNVYVRLWTLFGNTWQFNDYTYTAQGGGAKAAIISPTPGSGLAGPSVTFTWSAATGASAYWVDIGTTAGGFDLYSQGQALATSQTITGLPTDGRTVYVRLWTAAAGTWQYNDYTFKASGGSKAAILTPVPASTLSGSSVTFTWSAVSGAAAYWLDIGTTAGGFDLYSQGQALATSQTINGLPSGGSTIYVRLWTAIAGVWQYNDYTYKAAP
jgi:hypothetical protein